MPPTDILPLVSCIMPTHNRRAFVPQAIEYFLRQDYPNKELIIVDDGTDPVSDLVPADERIHYIRLDVKQPIGTKRNLACQEARGSIIIHWDDDDWHASYQLSYQVEEIQRLMGEDWIFYDPEHVETTADPAYPQRVSLNLAVPESERNIPMLTVAKAADLALPEYAAFNYGQSLPQMRRWELPFAL